MSAQAGAAQPQQNGVPGPSVQTEEETGAERPGPSLSGGSDPSQMRQKAAAESEKGDGDARGAPGPSSTSAAAAQCAGDVQEAEGAPSGVAGDQGMQTRADMSDQVGPSRVMSAGTQNMQTGVDLRSTAATDIGAGAYHTPRSSRSVFSSVHGMRPNQPGMWPGWVTRLGEMFKAPPVQWLPSPLPSPPRPRAATEMSATSQANAVSASSLMGPWQNALATREYLCKMFKVGHLVTMFLRVIQMCYLGMMQSSAPSDAFNAEVKITDKRRARSQEEWDQSSPVIVNLAGGESVSLRMNSASTILVPMASDASTGTSTPIVPLGALVGQLGYTMTWSSNRCRLEGRAGDVYNLRVREGCPEIAEHDALRLIARLEDENLALLKANTGETRKRVKAAALSMQRTWFDYLLSYVDGEMSSEALKAIESAPFLREVPAPCKAGLVETMPEDNGWRALRGLEHLNRRSRKRLWSSDKWVVHLFCGKKEKKDLHHLEAHGYTILELDIERGRTHDLLRSTTWRALEFAARKGKLAAIIGGPPQSSFMISRHVVGGPEPVRSNEFLFGNWEGQSDADVWLVNRETQLLTRMIYLHALASAGRIRAVPAPDAKREVALLLEHPRDPRGYLKFQDPLYGDVVSFWRTSLWLEYALEAGLNTYSFDMAAYGKAFSRHTTIGTNLAMKHINGLRARWHTDGPATERSPPSVWTTEFYEQVVIALRHWGTVPRMVKMSADQWREHVRRGHLPYRADCTVCVQAGATGRRHARIEHPNAYVLSADLAGPVKVGGLDPDARGAFPRLFKYIFVAKLRVPKTYVEDGRGAWVEYDGGELPEDQYEHADDGLEVEKKAAKEDVRAVVPPEEDDPDPDQEPKKKSDFEEDLDLAAPEMVNLMFSVGLKDDKAPTVLEAIQDVVLYCQSLNIPVLRFHSDRGMEFQARASKQWLKNQGIRVTASEAGAHQTNGSAEATVRWVKQRARTLLLAAKLPQRLWPMAVSTAATMQRADVLGFEPLLAAPFGANVIVRKRQMEGPKLDDLAPKWLKGTYLGKSESLHKGHLVYINDGDGEKFVHTLHVRAALHDPGPVEEELVAEEPETPSRRVRGKSSGSGDVVEISKAEILDEESYKARAEAVMEHWSQEEAESIVRELAAALPSTDNVYGMFRFGGKTGVTRATMERPWFTKLLLKLLLDKAPDAEFAAMFVSVRNDREVHIDRNNAMGTLNYLLPIVMPKRGGDIWQELREGDVVQGKVVELDAPDGKKRFGCTYPLQEGRVFQLNPHRRHAVLPWTGERLVIVGYTPGMLRNLTASDRERLWSLGFPMPLFDEVTGYVASINAFSVKQLNYKHGIVENYVDETLLPTARFSRAQAEPDAVEQSSDRCKSEEWEQWEMRLVLSESGGDVALAQSDEADSVCLRKAEVTYTDGVEEILQQLDGPLSIVHTVHPREVAANYEAWIPALKKEVATLSHAVEKTWANDAQVQEEMSSGRAQVIPMKIVFTVKPPDAPLPGESVEQFYKRKARIVVCGNLASHEPGDVYTNTAPAEIVRAALAISRVKKWNLGILDVIAAFLQTPFSELVGAPLVYGIPPKLLERVGLCQRGELWRLTHAVYGLQESPRLWGRYRDQQLARIQLIYEGKTVTLLQGRVEPSWWSILHEGSVLIGIVVIYVDDVLICGLTGIIKEVARAIKAIWKTNDLQLVSDGTIRFLGIEISMCSQGFALSQRSYIEELIRVHNVAPTRRDVIPLAKDLATFATEAEEGDYTEIELKAAQQCAGELLWISQRTRPDLSFVASLVGSLSTKAPRSSAGVAECVFYAVGCSFRAGSNAAFLGFNFGVVNCQWVWELEDKAPEIAERMGDLQLADLLTKALPSQRIGTLSKLMNLRNPENDDEGEIKITYNKSPSRINRAAAAPKNPKVLIALLVLSQATIGATQSWDEEEGLVVRSGMSIDYGIITWAILWGAVIVALLSWELLKWLLWLAYDKVTPGSRARRLRRLQKLRDATTTAIQREIQTRQGSRSEQRGRDSGLVPENQTANPPRDSSSTIQSSAASSGQDKYAEERMQLLRKLAKGVKETHEVGCQAGAFTPMPAPQTRVILRYVHEPPGEAYVLPGNDCYHVYSDCHAFRHRGTADRVERRRLCLYCLHRAEEDPDKTANYGEDLARAQEYERIFNTQLQVSGQPNQR
ncbi:GIP [Symbiodinium sp. CCMP2592]|nr:GIP [Symbiodinium sp. CCMP2592]